MQLISNFNKWFRFLLCVIDIYSKYAWVILLKDEKGITITNAFQKILDESNRKPNKIWVDIGSEFCNLSMKSFSENHFVAEILIRTLKNKIDKYMTSISKNISIGNLDDIINKCNNTHHSTIKNLFR